MLLYLLTQEKTERGDNDHFDKGKSFYFISTSDTDDEVAYSHLDIINEFQ